MYFSYCSSLAGYYHFTLYGVQRGKTQTPSRAGTFPLALCTLEGLVREQCNMLSERMVFCPCVDCFETKGNLTCMSLCEQKVNRCNWRRDDFSGRENPYIFFMGKQK